MSRNHPFSSKEGYLALSSTFFPLSIDLVKSASCGCIANSSDIPLTGMRVYSDAAADGSIIMLEDSCR